MACVLAVVTLALVAASPAGAHVDFWGSRPADGARVKEPPRELRLEFSDRVPPDTVWVAVEALGVSAVAAPAKADGDIVSVPLPPLGAGRARARYRVTSEDGHVVSGTIDFRILHGERPTGAVAAPPTGSGGGGIDAWPALSTLGRAVRDVGLVGALGGALFLLFVWLPALAATARAAPGWRIAAERFLVLWRRLATGGAVAAAAGAALMLTALAGETPGDALELRAGWAALMAIGAGLAGALAAAAHSRRRAPVLVEAIGADGLVLRPAPRPATGLLLAAGGALALAICLGGHGGELSAATALDVLHVIAAAAWIGGLVCLPLAWAATAAIREADDRSALRAAIAARLSTLALAAVLALAATGAAQMLVRLGAPPDPLASAYGALIYVKVVLFALLLGLATVSRRAVAGLPASEERLAAAVARELLFAAAVLGASVLLASSAPPG
jgi:copper transport protein